jgi:hypothetical protein
MSKGMRLRTTSKLEQERLDRLRKFIDLKAPRFILIRSAEQYLSSYRWSLPQTWFDWSMNHCPHWLLWLTSSIYRQVVREDEL